MTWRDHLTNSERLSVSMDRLTIAQAKATQKDCQARIRKIYDRARKRAAKEKPNAD